MNLTGIKSIAIPEGNVKAIHSGGTLLWSAPADESPWSAVAASIAAGTYATDYKIGDLVPLDLGAEGVVNMQIAGFDVDDKADGSGKAPISWISKELLKTAHRMNPARVTNDDGTNQEGTGSIGGWGKSEMRTYLNETIKPLIPENVRNIIVTVTKTQNAAISAGGYETQATEDNVWIPSKAEVEDASSAYYNLFENQDSKRIKYTTGTSTADNWHLRESAGYDNFNYVKTSGVTGMGSAKNAKKIALGFCT